MKKSFADCSICPLYGQEGKVCQTNCQNNITKIDVLYLIDKAEWWDDIQLNAEDKKEKYLITSPVLCKSNKILSDGEFKEIMDICKINANSIIKKINPKKIIAIGKFSKNVKAKKDSKIESYSSLDEFNNFLKQESDLEQDLDLFNENLFSDDEDRPGQIKTIGNSKAPHTFKIPEKYYTKKYRLVDIQAIYGQSRVIYIFRDDQNNKEYYEPPIKENDFYWYESLSTDNQLIEPFDNLELKIGNYKDRCRTPRGYGGDIKLTILHAVDYYFQNKEEAPIVDKNILDFDIEVYTYKDKIFPDPVQCNYPINAISFRSDRDDDTEHIYLLRLEKEIDPKIDELIKSKKYKTLTIFNNEYTLISAFLKKLRKYDPDFICGWNSNSFDIPYIVGRMKKLDIKMKEFSPFDNVYADQRGKVIITGIIALDKLTLYKNLTYINLPSYSLDYVAKHENVGEKVSYDGNLNTLYNDNIELFIEYSLNDSFLLKGIEDVKQHVSLQEELKRVTTNTHDSAVSTLGQAEGLFITSMKSKGLISRNFPRNTQKEDLPGAYVFDARGGLYDGLLCDFDFTSLYPSIINSWNIGPETLIGVLQDDNDKFNLIYQKEKLKNKKIKILLNPLYNNNPTEMSLEELESFIDDNNAQINLAGTLYKGHDQKESIFYTVIKMLFDGRKIYKKKMLDAKEKGEEELSNIFNGKQMAYKILANSLYGATGNEHFRFYNNDVARSITLAGQELLKYSGVHCDDYLVKRGNIGNFEMNIDFMTKVNSLQDVIYGDTDSLFVYLTDYLKDKNIEVKKSDEVQNEIDKIQNFINDTAISEFLKLHNIPKEKSLIFLKNEYLFSKYYTLNGKKHYAAKVISQEGKDINFVDVKGLEIKRSEIPPRSKKLLNNILNIILSEELEKDEIKEKVDKLVDMDRKLMKDLIDKRDHSIVRVVSYSKPLNKYKNFPQHIKAMLIWNYIVNEDFRYGCKGKLWNIKGIDWDKAPESVKQNFNSKFLKKFNYSDLDCVCVPEDVNKLPDYFVPDMNKIISYCCDDRVNNLTEPLWKESADILTF